MSIKRSILLSFVSICVTLLCGSKSFAQNTIIDWNFPSNPDNATVDYSTTANSASTITTSGGTNAISFSTAGASTNSASASGWNAGSGSKWWEINFSTLYYSGLQLSSKQRSSGTGPRDFKVQYKIGAGGTWTDLTGATAITVANDYDSGIITDVSLPSACENQSSVYLRWIMTSNTHITGGTVAAGGVSNIDDIKIQGTAVVHWYFPSGSANATVDQSITANSACTIAPVGGPASVAYTNVGASDYCIWASGWDSGNGTKYWQVSFSTVSYYNLELSSRQRSSATGPRDFKVQYKVGSGGSWTDLTGATAITCADDFDAGVLLHIMLPAACENQDLVYLRYIMTSNTAVNAGTVANTGSSRIDELVVSGSLNNYHYRSTVSTGTWIALTSWETSLDLVSWKAAPALAPPTYRSLTVTVRNTHTITYSTADSLDQLTIDVGGKLVYMAAPTIYDGTGADIVVNGSIVDSCTADAIFLSSATWSIGSAGYFYKHLAANFSVWRDNYASGMNSIPSSATVCIWKTGATSPTFTTVGGTYYPNFIVKNTSGSAWTTTFSGSAAFPTIKGDFDVGGDGTDAVNFENLCTHLTPVPVTGNITVRSGSSLKIGNGSTSGTGFETLGNLIVDGTLGYGSTAGSVREIKFSWTNAQTISGSGTLNFYTLEVNKPSNTLTLSSSIAIDDSLYLPSGIVVSSSANIINMSATSYTAGASNSSFVKGPVKKTGTTAFTFPVGKDSEYRPISISNLSGSESFTAEYFHYSPSWGINVAPCPCSGALFEPTLDHISNCEYWTLDRAGAQDANVTLSWDTYSCGITSPSALSVARWDAGAPIWQDMGNGGTTGTNSAGTVVSIGYPTGYGPFTLASTSAGVNPLPIGLIDFTAKHSNNKVELKWTTGSEMDNDFFTIERSSDAHSFYHLMNVKGAGSTDLESHYNAIDPSPISGVSYYRLSQTDFSGHTEILKMIAVNANDDVSEMIHFIRTEKESEKVILSMAGGIDEDVSLIVRDVSGRMIYSSMLNTTSADEFRINFAGIQEGIYFLTLANEKYRITKKFIY